VIAAMQGRGQAAGTAIVAAQAGVPELAASSLKAALDRDWDDPAARDGALAEVPGLLERVEAFIAGQAGEETAAEAVAVARQVRDQDVDLTGPAPALRRGVAKDRRISVEDSQMRHGRKSRSVRFDGYKRHVLRDLDTGLVPAVGVTPANAPEASVTDAIAADLDAAGWRLSELHIDRAYLSSALVRDRGPDLVIFCKAWRVRNTGGRFAKDQFTLDFAAGQLTCPAGVTMPFQAGKTVRFPAGTCAACPLRQRCTTSSHGRSVSIHPDEALLAELRRRQQDPDGRAKLRERVAVEHALAHVGHWQGRRARYRGTRKNLFDLRRALGAAACRWRNPSCLARRAGIHTGLPARPVGFHPRASVADLRRSYWPRGWVRHLAASRPSRRAARAASSAREEMPSLWKMLVRWVVTVRREMNMRAAICGLDRPSATAWATVISVRVRLSQPSPARAGTGGRGRG
jgi:hypothetical protein